MTSIRKATQNDARFIFDLIKQLADFEKALEQVTLSYDQFILDGFGENPQFESFILTHEQKNVGFGLYYNRYSTWKGKSLYLEDLYILPEARRLGLGQKAMDYLKQIAIETNCGRFEWQVLEWNKPAIELYKKMSADLDAEWINCRLEGDNLTS